MLERTNFLRNLPEDILTNILIKLPIKSLVTCICVCKSWNFFIKSAYFVSSQLQRTISSKDARLLLFQLCSRPVGTGTDSFTLCFDDEELSEYAPLHFPYKHESRFEVISSCNGLVLLVNGKLRLHPGCLILWNPVIRKSVILKEDIDYLSLVAAGLGFSSKTSDYKLLTIIDEVYHKTDVNQVEISSKPTLKVELYSLKANSWKRLPDVEATLSRTGTKRGRGEMTFLNGAFHLIVSRPHREPSLLILAFNLDEEVFHEIKFPKCMDDGWRYGFLWACGEELSISLLRRVDKVQELHIWVMKEYGVEESWTHLSTVTLRRLSCSLDNFQVIYRKNNHVLFNVGHYIRFQFSASDIYSHDLKSHETEYLGYCRGKQACFFLDSFVESLILIDKGNDLSRHFEDASCESSSSYAACTIDGEGASSIVTRSERGINPLQVLMD